MIIAPLFMTPDDHVSIGNSLREFRTSLMFLMCRTIEGTREHDLTRKSIIAADQLRTELDLRLLHLVEPNRDPRRLLPSVYTGTVPLCFREYCPDEMNTDAFCVWQLSR